MTVSSETSHVEYTCNGATVNFPVTFRFLENAHVAVYLVLISTGTETLLTQNSQYTITGAGASTGGTVTTVATYSSLYQIAIRRSIPITQLTDYIQNDDFPAESHEDALDKLTMIVQQRSYELQKIVQTLSTNYPNSLRLHAWAVACSNRTTALAAATKVGRFYLPYGFYVMGVMADLGTVQASGSILTVDCNLNGVSILGAKCTIDNGEKTSITAAAPATLVTPALPSGGEITFDIDQVGDGTALWLQCTVWGYQL